MKEIGRRLKARREELGLTMDQVQAETKIRRRYLEALEAGKDEVIPGEVYVKGFLRFYANFLGLDGVGLVKEYNDWKAAQAAAAMAEVQAARGRRRRGPRAPSEAEAAPDKTGRAAKPGAPPGTGPVAPAAGPSLPPVSATPRVAAAAPPAPSTPPAAPALPPRSLSAEGRRRNGRGGRLAVSVLVILVLVATAGVWYVWSHAQAPASGGTDGTTAEPGEGAGTQPGGSTEEPTGGDSGQPGADGAPVGWALLGESDRLTRYVVYGAPFVVGLEVVSEKCWVQVMADGQTVFEQTMEAGAKGEWTARSEMSIVFGRPQLVRVSLNGQVVGLAGTKDQPRTLRFEASGSTGGGGGTGGA